MAEEFVDSEHSSLWTVLCLRKGSAVLQASLVDALLLWQPLDLGGKPLPLGISADPHSRIRRLGREINAS